MSEHDFWMGIFMALALGVFAGMILMVFFVSIPIETKLINCREEWCKLQDNPYCVDRKSNLVEVEKVEEEMIKAKRDGK